VNTPTKIQRTPLSKRSTGSLLLTFIAALFGAIGLLLVAVERTDAQAQGEVWAWGLNGAGQLGDGTTTLQRNTPVQTSGLSGVQSIGSGLFHSLEQLAISLVCASSWSDGCLFGRSQTEDSPSPKRAAHEQERGCPRFRG